jgi:hypothetical protein
MADGRKRTANKKPRTSKPMRGDKRHSEGGGGSKNAAERIYTFRGDALSVN